MVRDDLPFSKKGEDMCMDNTVKLKHQAQTSRLKEWSQQTSSAKKLSYQEKKWFYSLGGFDKYQPANLYKYLLQMDNADQQMIILMQELDKIHQRFDHVQQQERTKWYHASQFINTWLGFIIANTLLDPVKAVIFETIKAATPLFEVAANYFLNYTAKVSQAIRDSLGK